MGRSELKKALSTRDLAKVIWLAERSKINTLYKLIIWLDN